MLAAINQSSQVPYADVPTVESGDISRVDDNGQHNGSYANVNKEKMENKLNSSLLAINDELLPRADKRSGRVVQPTVDVAEIIRHWTHALHRILKQSLHLVFCFLLHHYIWYVVFCYRLSFKCGYLLWRFCVHLLRFELNGGPFDFFSLIFANVSEINFDLYFPRRCRYESRI